MAEAAKYDPDTFSAEEYKHIKTLIKRREILREYKLKRPNFFLEISKQELAALNWVLTLLEEISTED